MPTGSPTIGGPHRPQKKRSLFSLPFWPAAAPTGQWVAAAVIARAIVSAAKTRPARKLGDRHAEKGQTVEICKRSQPNGVGGEAFREPRGAVGELSVPMHHAGTPPTAPTGERQASPPTPPGTSIEGLFPQPARPAPESRHRSARRHHSSRVRVRHRRADCRRSPGSAARPRRGC